VKEGVSPCHHSYPAASEGRSTLVETGALVAAVLSDPIRTDVSGPVRHVRRASHTAMDERTAPDVLSHA